MKYTIQQDGRWDFYIDNSALKDFRLCEQYFKYHHLDNIGQKGLMPYVIDLGSWWSSTMESIYTYIQETGSVSLAMAQQISAGEWVSKGMESHKDDKRYEKFGGQYGAITMIDQYYERHLVNDMKNWKIIGAEAGFGLKGECLVGENNKVIVHWVGKPDLTVLAEHRLTPLDHKTVSGIDADISGKYKPNTQLAGYVFATQLIARNLGLDVTVDRVIVNVCSRVEPTDKPRNGKPVRPRFVRVTPGYSQSEIEEWQRQTVWKVTRLREAIESGNYLWNENSCHNMYYRPCPYRGLCSIPSGARPDVIRGNYQQIQKWTPYEVEED